MTVEPLLHSDIHDFITRLAVPVDDPTDTDRYERIAVLESVKAACAAAQVGPTVTLGTAVTVPRLVSDGTTITRIDPHKTLASELGLARKTSPVAGSHWNARARVLATDMPHTLALLTCGILTEKRAETLIRETNGLTADERRQIDKELCADPNVLRDCGDASVEARVKTRAIELNNKAVAERAKRAERERRVTSRPAPDCMAYFTALVPMTQSVAMWATLRRDADSLVATGNSGGRTRDQLMADLLINRVLGIESASDIPVTVNVIVSDRTLLGGGDAPAHISGIGPVPAQVLMQTIADPQVQLDLRRLYTVPATGELVAMEAKSRTFPAGLRRWIEFRDQVCRTPFCDAPIRHGDHIVEQSQGGATSADNGAGLCAHCNQVKNEPGWFSKPIHAPGRHTYRLLTPSGRQYSSTAPPLPGPELYSVPENAVVEWITSAA
ncbi:HNH endonuclease [Actinomycetes bacterium M1A6_2h]